MGMTHLCVFVEYTTDCYIQVYYFYLLAEFQRGSEASLFVFPIIRKCASCLLSCQYMQRKSGERNNSECVRASAKHSADSVVVLGCIDASGFWDLVNTDEIVATYCSAMRRWCCSMQYYLENSLKFQHSHHPKHTALKH